MSKLRMGVIGLGDISETHIKGILESPEMEFVAVCDADGERLRQKGGLYGIPESRRFNSHIDLLECEEIDAVSICTPNNTHFEIASDVIRSGKPFALEKPVTMNYSQAAALDGIIRETRVPCMVCYSYRFKAAARYARWIINEGHLGRIFHVYGQYLQGWGISPEVPLIWRFRKDVSGSGALGDLGSHMIDLTRFLVGNFSRVCAHGDTFTSTRKVPGTDKPGKVDVDDYCHFMAELDGGVSGTFAITRNAFGRANYQRMEIYGSKGALVYSLEEEDILNVCLGDVYGGSFDFHRISVPQQFEAQQMQAFCDIVRGKGDGLAATFEDGLMSQLVIDNIIKSFESRKWVDIKG